MASHSGVVHLLVLVGVALASGGPIQFISEHLKGAHGSITEELELKRPEIGLHPLFSSVIASINNSCQRQTDMQLVNATLDVYMRIFSSILLHSHHKHHGTTHTSGLLNRLSTPKRSEVTSALKELQKLMENLRNYLNRQNNDTEDVLSKLNKIKVDDPMVQRKALAEFMEVYQAASVISTSSC
ncbi:interferon gamma 1 [Leuresthes tenuis]|uniref:interferon gamma 1 n=1 Tax=Leuresthes tenuis TaxID=355514 RepID=UPI003B50682F